MESALEKGCFRLLTVKEAIPSDLMSKTSKSPMLRAASYLPTTDAEKAEAFRLHDKLLNELAKELSLIHI